MLQNRTLLIVGEYLKKFQLDSTTCLPGGMTKDFQNFYQLLLITLSKVQPNAKWALYSIIDGANLVEFAVVEGCF